MMVGFAAGGTTDFVARLLAEAAEGALGQQIVIENKPGANGAIGAEYVAKSEPDGYTLFLSTVGALAINPILRTDLPYDPLKDFAPIAPPRRRNHRCWCVDPGLGIDSAQELVARAKEKPGTITVGITGIGAISHLEPRDVRVGGRDQIAHVPYRGSGPAISDLLGGQVNGVIVDVAVMIEQIKAGKAKVHRHDGGGALAVPARRADPRRAGLHRGGRRQLDRACSRRPRRRGRSSPSSTPSSPASLNDPQTRSKIEENGVSAAADDAGGIRRDHQAGDGALGHA